MGGSDWLVLLGVFLGGAAPWLEAVVVIPFGILAGPPVVLVVLAGVTGNLLTVALAAWSGEWLRAWWIARRGAHGPRGGGERRSRRRERILGIMHRWGMVGLATLGPIGLGTQLSALAGVATGVRAGRAFAWVGAGTVAWSLIAAAATLGGVSIAGVGV